jgi:hypothetical protein
MEAVQADGPWLRARSLVILEVVMRGKYYATVVILIFILMAGCAHYGALEEDYGKSYNAAKSGQILNPGASKNLKPVTGLPGAAADGTMKKYTESFAPKDQPQNPAPQGSTTQQTSIGMGQDGYGKK